MIAVILAGGRSSRMLSVDKCLHNLGGTSLLEIIYRKLERSREFTDIHVLASHLNANHLIDLGFNVIIDNILAGPLTAIYQLRIFNEFFVIACDTPFISIESIKRLLSMCINSASACIPRWRSTRYLEPLFAIYRSKAIDLLEICLLKGELSINRCLNNSESIMYLDVDQVFKDPRGELFNINTLDDLNKIKDLAIIHLY
ncbi:MAG: molybdenum cofactor guanylyltransferase [Desulfurococcaceae archaeon]